VNLSPNSFMAQDLLGWALYRNETYAPAKTAFLTALRENPQGAGAMAGMMWCGVMTQDKDEATYWSARKAEVCKGDVEAAREKALRLLKKYS
jgi:TolA-binding protein